MERTGFGLCLLALISGCLGSITIQISSEKPMSIDDDITFSCRVEDFPPGGAVAWWKRQGSEEIKLGVNKSLNSGLDRYSLEISQANSVTVFYLNIKGIKPEDNGDFGCSLEGDETTKAYGNLVVSDPVNSVRLYRVAGAGSTDILKEYVDQEVFDFNEDEEYYFMCVASGSNPQPDVSITIGYGDDVTSLNDYFNRSEKLISDSASGEAAFRKTNYEATLISSQSAPISWKSNSQDLVCAAAVPNMDEPKSVTIKPVLKMSPIIECKDEMKVPLWADRVTLECNVYADPPLQDIRWYWGTEYRGTSLLPGEWLGVYTFHLDNGSKPDMKVARLTIDKVFINAFLKYNLNAKNEKGQTTHALTLVRGKGRY